jgi:hypothetical protein
MRWKSLPPKDKHDKPTVPLSEISTGYFIEEGEGDGILNDCTSVLEKEILY